MNDTFSRILCSSILYILDHDIEENQIGMAISALEDCLLKKNEAWQHRYRVRGKKIKTEQLGGNLLSSLIRVGNLDALIVAAKYLDLNNIVYLPDDHSRMRKTPFEIALKNIWVNSGLALKFLLSQTKVKLPPLDRIPFDEYGYAQLNIIYEFDALQLIQKYHESVKKTRSACITLLMIKKYKRSVLFESNVPRDVVLIICRFVWESRRNISIWKCQLERRNAKRQKK